MIGQIRTRTVKTSAVMRSAAFMRGFKEAHKGIPMDYDAYTGAREVDKRWDYERGRQFGFIYDGDVKDGGRIRHDALYEYALASRRNWVR